MLKINLRKFENLVSLVHNSLAAKKSIIIFVGSSGTYLGAIKRNVCVDSLFIPLEDRDNLELYKYFFKKYKGFYIFFLYDDEACELKHELVPVLQSVVKVNPIEKFIEEHYQSSDIIAHHVYNISTKNGEVWDSLIVKAPYAPPLSDLLNYVLENSLKFSGIHFLNLEYITIINKILEKTNKLELSNHLQIFTYITKVNSIKFIVKHKENIISLKTVPYPVDRTELYVQGIIEQEVSDYTISLKNYVLKNSLKICVICLVNSSLKDLLQQSKFEPHEVLIASNNEISATRNLSAEGFSDSVIAELFANNKTYPAFNKSVKSITQANVVNFLIFKPLLGFIVTLVIILANLKFLTVKNIKNIEVLDTQSFQVIEEYRNVRQKYPDIKNVANLADLYSLTALLKVPVLAPFDFLESFVKDLPADIYLNKISWILNDPNNSLYIENYINIVVNFKYIKTDISVDETLANLNSYINHLKENFKSFTISYTYSGEPLNTLNRVIVPVTLTVSGPRKL